MAHRAYKSSPNDDVLAFADTVQNINKCEPCSVRNKSVEPTKFCQDCEEYLCESCTIEHRSHKQNKNHTIRKINEVLHCDPCLVNGKTETAAKFCLDCEEPEPLCASCADIHITMKRTRGHRFSSDICSLNSSKQGEIPEKTDFKIAQYRFENPCVKKIREEPEKPYVTEDEGTSNHINLKWEHNKILCAEESYQISFKELSQGKWKVFSLPMPCRNQMVVIDGLKADTSYVFKVRVADENTGIEGPFSPESEIIRTGVSPALRIMKKSIKSATGPPDIYMLPITENKAARNESAQTRKFTLGSPGKRIHTQEKTIMMVGATGSGKSTLINSMANYAMGVTWEDPFRFALVNLEKCEKNRKGNEAVSQTEWITCYTIYNDVSSRINYTINLIDTPGFGDTRGLTQDAKVVSQIRKLFSANGEKGVKVIDAVCFILKAPDARLTTTQKYIFESILALFGKDIVENICTLVTFADGQRPPVLAGLEALPGKPLPYKVYFSFNNSALFVKNGDTDPASLSPFFWDMGMKSCENFFLKIQSLQTKSLLLTSEVLTKRQKLENTILHLQEDIDKGLTKINSLEKQIEMLKKYECQIKENKDFEFTTVVPDIKKVDISGKGIHTTTCLVCNYTCHNNCAFAKDEDKERCVAMTDGKCTECPKRCKWDIHFNLPHIFEHKTKTIKETYSEMQVKYQEASKKKLTHGQLIQEINADIQTLECGIQVMIEEITEYTNRLKEIALRPDPLSTVEYIELMIESEKLEKNKGFLQRIQVLEQCKRRAQFGKSYDFFTQRLKTSRTHIDQGYHQEPTQYSEQEKQRFSHNAIQRFMKLFS